MEEDQEMEKIERGPKGNYLPTVEVFEVQMRIQDVMSKRATIFSMSVIRLLFSAVSFVEFLKVTIQSIACC